MIPARDSFAGRRQVLLTYMDQYKINSFPWVAITGLLLSLFIMTVPAGHHLIVPLILGGIGILIYIILTVLHFFSPILQMVMPMMLWFTLWAQLLTACLYRRGDSFNELLGWALYIQFVTVCTVPQSRNQLIFCSVSSMVGYLAVQCFNAWDMLEHFPTDFVLQMLTNAFLFSVATIIGISAYITWNKKIDTLYEQVIYTLFIKKAMEKQTQEEERLVLSVLPEHVAVQMRDNLGLMDTQFKKIYMSRHENVSILYADIVGFTAISSTYSAQDLVAILNELFARFDRLAEKFDQLRIKILGDCYYCISGAPVERDDHAALCVYMGLSMVKAIKYVQQTTNSPVDMRVGIHTGAVLAGVLGQRQWQFDVYSRDVELANKMESSGMAGRVHISEVTLSYLNGEFEVEPAYGEKREEMLRQAGIKTYFITKVLKPHPKYADTDATDDADMTTENNSTRDEEEEEANSREAMLNSNQLTSAEQHFTEDEFISLYTSLTPEKTDYWVTFYNKEVEAEYVKQLAPCHIISTRLPFLVLPAFIIMSTFIVPVAWTHVIFFLSIVLSLVYNWYWRFFIPIKMDIPSNFTSLIVYTIIGLLVLTNFSSLIMCGLFKNPCKDMYSMSDTTPGPAEEDTARCYHSTYYYHVGVVAICATYWLRGSHMVRSLVIISIVIFNSLPALITPVEIDPKIDFDPYPYELCKNTTILNLINAHDFDMVIVTLHDYRNVLMLVFIAIALINFNAFYERQDRSRFCRHRTLLAENRHYQEKTKRNQAMVNNVLPPHVAKHFMGGQHNHRDLYSQSYSEVGVLFAAMPNFTEFYSEESVNNQGLECLRFLNEVISDFDMLLDDPRFCKHIVKIKTISSTYMAASGLGPKDKLKTSNSVVVRWAHLSWLVVFALELQRTLAAINEQSFNHFVLRLGINHGPITAGVIGARKPHYDIWGNTVNVASRMESTGKAGCIQVTSETAQILEEFGYQFEQRGLVAVKGKGELMTYYLLDKNLPKPLPIDGNPSQSKPAKTETRQVTPGPSKNETKGTSKSKW